MAENDDLRADIKIGTTDIDRAAKKAKDLERKVEALRKAQLQAVKISNSKLEASLKKSLKNREISYKDYVSKVSKLEQTKARKIEQINLKSEQRLTRIQAARTRTASAGAPTAAGGLNLTKFAGVGLAAAGVKRLGSALFDLAVETDKANKALEAMDSLVNAKLGSESIPKARAELTKLTASGLLNKSDAAQAIKNLTSMGFSIEQSSKLISDNTDIAVKNKQSHLTTSEAVKVWTEGLKNNNSVLSDATGISENITPMLKRLGLTHDALGKAAAGSAAHQKVVNEIMKQTAPFAGDAAKSMDSFSGTIAKMNVVWTDLKLKLGEGAQVIFNQILPPLTDLIGKFFALTKTLGSTKAGAAALTVLFWPLVKIFTITVNILKGVAAALGWVFDGFRILIETIESNRAFQTLIRVLKIAWKIASDFAKELRDNVVGALESIGNSGFLTGLQDAFTFLFQGVLKFMAVLNQMKDVAMPIIKGMADGWESVGKAMLFQFEAAKQASRESKAAFAEAGKASTDFMGKARTTYRQWLALRDEVKKGTGITGPPGSGGKGKGGGGGAGFTPDQIVGGKTTAEKLQEESDYLEQQKALHKNFWAESAINDRQREIEAQLKLDQKNNFQLQALDKLERDKLKLIDKHNKAKSKNEQKLLKHSIKLKDIEIKAEQKKIAIQQGLDQAAKKVRAERAQTMFEFGQALLSKEKGSLTKFFASQIRQFTAMLAKKKYAEGLYYAALPGMQGLAAAQFAAGAAIQVAGEVGARVVESLAPKEAATEAGPSLPNFSAGDDPALSSQVSGDSISNTGGNTTIINNYNNNNNVEIRELGTYLKEEEYVRNKVIPQMQNIALERGSVIFKKSA